MNTEERRELERALPESYKKGSSLSGLGAAIGAGLGDLFGWSVGGHQSHFIYAGMGAGVGIVAGYVAAFVLGRRMELTRIERISVDADRIVGVLGFGLAAAGIVGFAMTGEWIGLVGALFFFACGWYLVARH